MYSNEEDKKPEVEAKVSKKKKKQPAKVEKFAHVVGLDDARAEIRQWFMDAAVGTDFPWASLVELAKWGLKKGL